MTEPTTTTAEERAQAWYEERVRGSFYRLELANSAIVTLAALLRLHTFSRPASITRERLMEETGLPRRTLRFGLSRLKEHGLAESVIALDDARTMRYFATPLALKWFY